jgi:hypothetical protein
LGFVVAGLSSQVSIIIALKEMQRHCFESDWLGEIHRDVVLKRVGSDDTGELRLRGGGLSSELGH